MGNNFGKPFDKDMQFVILRKALALVYEAEQGGILIDYPEDWPEPFEYFRSIANG